MIFLQMIRFSEKFELVGLSPSPTPKSWGLNIWEPCTIFHDNPSNRWHWTNTQIFQPAGGARGKVRGSPKPEGFIVWRLWMSVQNVKAIHQIFHEILQSVVDQPTKQHCHRAMPLAWLKKAIKTVHWLENAPIFILPLVLSLQWGGQKDELLLQGVNKKQWKSITFLWTGSAAVRLSFAITASLRPPLRCLSQPASGLKANKPAWRLSLQTAIHAARITSPWCHPSPGYEGACGFELFDEDVIRAWQLER